MKVDLNMTEIAREGLRMNVEMHGVTEFRCRLWLTLWVLRLLSAVAPCPVIIDLNQT